MTSIRFTQPYQLLPQDLLQTQNEYTDTEQISICSKHETTPRHFL